MNWTKKQRDGNRGRWQRSVWVCHCVLKVSENESEIDNKKTIEIWNVLRR